MIDLLKKIFILSVFINTAFAQNYKKITFCFPKPNIVGGYSVKLNSKQSSSGLFVDKLEYKCKGNKGFLEFNIFPEGYQELKYSFRIDTLNHENKIPLPLNEKNIELNEVIVSTKRNRFSKNGDTISVYVEDIKTKPHAEASELFDRIEGFESNDNGSYKIFGSSVDIVMIDGKRIFGGNPALTLSNINADMIKSIDIIENNSRIGGRKKAINIRLKPNKKNGSYGHLGFGFGTKSAQDLNFKANKLLKNGIFSSFGTSNSISLFKDKTITDNELVEEFYSKNTFFGYTNKSETKQNLVEIDELNTGLFKENLLGGSVNLNNKLSSQTFNALLNTNTQAYQSSILGNTIIDENKIETKNYSDGNQSKQSSFFSYDIQKKIGRYNTSIFKIESKFNNFQQKKIDSLYYNDGDIVNSRFLRFQKKVNENYLKLDFGSAFNHKNGKVKTLIYSKILLNNQKTFSSLLQNINSLDQKLNNFFFIAEITQSYPVSKRILIEHRPYFSTEKSELAYKFTKESNRETVQNLVRFDNWLYFQQGKLLLNADLAFISYFQTYINKNTFRLRKLNIKFPKNEFLTKFDFNYENDLILPSNLERVGIADSLNFYFRQNGNENLKPFFSKRLSISYSNTNLEFINLFSNIDLRKDTKSIQSNSYFVDNLLYITSKTNIDRQLFSVNGNIFLSFKNLPKKVDMSINHIFSVGQSLNIFNNQFIFGKSSFHLLNWQTVIKSSSSFSLKNVVASNFSSFQKLKTQSFEHSIKLSFDIKDKIFSKITYKSIFGTTIPFQPILNFEIQKFIAKDKIGLEVKVINLLNIRNNSIINQSTIQQFVTQSNTIPRIFLGKISFYLEKWK